MLDGLANGEVHYALTSTDVTYLRPGNVVHYSCNVGYTLEGADTATCLMNGNWSETVPSCLPGLHK